MCITIYIHTYIDVVCHVIISHAMGPSNPPLTIYSQCPSSWPCTLTLSYNTRSSALNTCTYTSCPDANQKKGLFSGCVFFFNNDIYRSRLPIWRIKIVVSNLVFHNGDLEFNNSMEVLSFTISRY